MISPIPRYPVETNRLDTSSTNITTGAWVTVVAATLKPSSFISIYNPTTKILQLAIGASGSEVAVPYTVPPSLVPQLIPVDSAIPKGSRISAKAIDANATSGLLVLNHFA